MKAFKFKNRQIFTSRTLNLCRDWRRLIILLLLVLVSSRNYGQDARTYQHEFEFSIDNDAFLISDLDRYYSSGLSLKWRKSIGTHRKLHDLFNRTFNGLVNMVGEVKVGHHFYTNRGVREPKVERFDRPYAGWLYVATGLTIAPSTRSILRGELDLGVVGPLAGGGSVQTWWHKTVGLPKPKGWDYQLENTPAINLSLEFLRQVADLGYLDLISESSLQVGTIHNNLRQGLVFRAIKPGFLSNSIYTRSKLGNGLEVLNSDSKYDKILEIYLLGGAAIEYVFYNSLIEGNFIGKPSSHVEAANPWVIHWKYGIAFGGHSADVNLTVHHLTSETTQSIGHAYGSLDFVVRF